MSMLDKGRIRSRMSELGFNMTRLASAAGLSRQSVYAILRPGYRPVATGVEALAVALGVEPLDLLRRDESDSGVVETAAWIRQSATGDPRAFEVLPAALLMTRPENLNSLALDTPVEHQLAACAADIAIALSGVRTLAAFAQRHSSMAEPNRAFFFGLAGMTPERIVQQTPAPMQRHLVFGAFDMLSFQRHFLHAD